MPVPDVAVELVHSPSRHRALIGWSSDPALLRVTAEQLICEAERRAEQFTGLDDRGDDFRLHTVARGVTNVCRC